MPTSPNTEDEMAETIREFITAQEEPSDFALDALSRMRSSFVSLREQNATLGAELSEAHQEIESLRQERDELAKRLESEQRAHAATADSCAKEIATLKAALQRQVER